MTCTVTTLGQFFVLGIAVKTTNENGQAQKDIGELWQRFFKDNITSLIPNKVGEDIYCIYTDYEGESKTVYTTILGHKVTSLQNIPGRLTGKAIPKTTYHLYTSVGKLPDCVVSTWEHIWNTPLRRAWLADFDVYGAKSRDPDNAEVATYLSVQ